ncbi:histone-lysine N-methyltransferase SETMAR-like [Amphiura filiformis]|uniref:histone-lysine N-methyltransferase SETMAR-like n=1 Tax=Amphiura filiformis TaxID=82378 RepID=UPI003B210F71
MATSEELFGDDSKYVTCSSDVNGAVPVPDSFKYTAVNVAGPGLQQDPSEIVYSGCDCTLPSCGQHCPCIQMFGPSYTEDAKLVTSSSQTLPSTDNDIITKPVLECSASCQCSSECINRVVQNGPRFQLQVFNTTTKGWGLRAVEKIPKNTFVCEYAGEILTDKEAKKRTDALTGDDMNYILVVKENISDEKVIRTNIDPAIIGNVGRFINHSCNPNLFQVVVRIENEIPRVGLFAVRDIEALEELSYSYWGDTKQGQLDGMGRLHKPCYCEGPNCSGFLPIDASLF